MNTVLLVAAGRPVPPALLAYGQRAGWQVRILAAGEDPVPALAEVQAVMLLSPFWVNRTYAYGEQLWHNFLRRRAAHLPLLIAGYQRAEHPNYLDLLQLEQAAQQWWEQLQPVSALPEDVYRDTLLPKLYRFFAGHGSDSIVAVLIRIRLLVQMAQRECQQMGTPYAEVYRDLIAPARLGEKWADWRNRWINYFPYFSYTPLAVPLAGVGQRAEQLDDWMSRGGVAEAPLANGEILAILNALRDTLQEIENQYVLQKLPHSHR